MCERQRSTWHGSPPAGVSSEPGGAVHGVFTSIHHSHQASDTRGLESRTEGAASGSAGPTNAGILPCVCRRHLSTTRRIETRWKAARCCVSARHRQRQPRIAPDPVTALRAPLVQHISSSVSVSNRQAHPQSAPVLLQQRTSHTSQTHPSAPSITAASVAEPVFHRPPRLSGSNVSHRWRCTAHGLPPIYAHTTPALSG